MSNYAQEGSILNHAAGSNNPFVAQGLDTTPAPTTPFTAPLTGGTRSTGPALTQLPTDGTPFATSASNPPTSFATPSAIGTQASSSIQSSTPSLSQFSSTEPTSKSTPITSSITSAVTAGDGPQNSAEKHVDNLATGLAGIVLTAPLAALESVAPAFSEKLTNAASVAADHAKNLATKLPSTEKVTSSLPTTEQVQGHAANLSQTVQSSLPTQETLQAHAANAGNLATQAKDTLLSYIPASIGGTSGSNVASTGTHPINPLTGESNPLVANVAAKLETVDVPITGRQDTGRQDLSSEISSSVNMDSQKTYTESATDIVKEKADAAASYAQPESNKSFSQKASDTFGSTTNTSFGATDTGRQSVGDKFSSAVTPDSQKSYSQSAKDVFEGKADSLASVVQPNSTKSSGQSLTDTFTGN